MNPKFYGWSNEKALDEYARKLLKCPYGYHLGPEYTLKELEDEILARMKIGVQ